MPKIELNKPTLDFKKCEKNPCNSYKHVSAYRAKILAFLHCNQYFFYQTAIAVKLLMI